MAKKKTGAQKILSFLFGVHKGHPVVRAHRRYRRTRYARRHPVSRLFR